MPFPYWFPIEFGVLDSIEVVIADTLPVLVKGSPVVENRIEERSTAQFTVVDLGGALSYQQGQPVAIYDTADELIFGGVIDNPEKIRLAPSGELYHPIRCKDWHYLADKRLVAESYLATAAGTIVEDIVTKYLAAEGVTIENVEDGPIIIEAVFNYVRASDAFDALAEKSSKIWWIDELKRLYFQNRDTDLVLWTLDGNDIEKGTGRLSGANPLYRNRQYIRGGRATTALQTENFIGDNTRNAFTLSFPVQKEPDSIKLATVAQTMGVKGFDAPGDFQVYWAKGDATIYFTAVPAAVAIEVKYFGEFDILTLVADAAEVLAQRTVEEDGTGYVESIADEPTLNDKDASFDSGLAKLAKYGVNAQRFPFSTERKLKPGQLLPVNYPALSLDTDMLIESVTTRVYAGQITYDVVAITGPGMVWTNYFKALSAMKQEVIDRLNVGSNQILIILELVDELWEWDEVFPDPVVTICPFPAATLFPEPTLYPC